MKPNVIKTVQDFEREELKDGCCAELSDTDIDFQIDTKNSNSLKRKLNYQNGQVETLPTSENHMKTQCQLSDVQYIQHTKKKTRSKQAIESKRKFKDAHDTEFR